MIWRIRHVIHTKPNGPTIVPKSRLDINENNNEIAHRVTANMADSDDWMQATNVYMYIDSTWMEYVMRVAHLLCPAQNIIIIQNTKEKKKKRTNKQRNNNNNTQTDLQHNKN